MESLFIAVGWRVHKRPHVDLSVQGLFGAVPIAMKDE